MGLVGLGPYLGIAMLLPASAPPPPPPHTHRMSFLRYCSMPVQKGDTTKCKIFANEKKRIYLRQFEYKIYEHNICWDLLILFSEIAFSMSPANKNYLCHNKAVPHKLQKTIHVKIYSLPEPQRELSTFSTNCERCEGQYRNAY